MSDPKDKLKEAGVEPGTWGQAGDRQVRPQILDEQLALMQKLKGILEQTEGHLQGELVRAKETLARLKHGGGR